MDNNIWHHFPKVDLKKFDGSNPLVWVTQMERYFPLHGIIDDMMKLIVGYYTFTMSDSNGGNGIKNPILGTLSRVNFEIHLCSF